MKAHAKKNPLQTGGIYLIFMIHLYHNQPNKKLKAGAAVHEGNKEARKYNGKDRMISWMWQQQVDTQWPLLA